MLYSYEKTISKEKERVCKRENAGSLANHALDSVLRNTSFHILFQLFFYRCPTLDVLSLLT